MLKKLYCDIPPSVAPF